MKKNKIPLLTHLEQIDRNTKEGKWLIGAYSVIRAFAPEMKPHEVKAKINEGTEICFKQITE